MINSRSLTDLTPDAVKWFERFRVKVEQELGMSYGFDWGVTSTYRDQEFQNNLYEQGRTKPGKVVTWTRHSRHTARRAWDIVVKDKDGNLVWDVKADTNADNIPDYKQLAGIGKSMGLHCGADYGDWCHFEAPEVVG